MSDKYAALRAAAEEEIMCREAGDTSDAWQDESSPECITELLAEREADKERIAELTEALKHSVAGYKSCLRMGHDRIIDLGGDCDSPEVMIAGNPDIRQAEKLLAAGITLETGE